ncbi:MAG: hypothetical protein QFB86_04340 [Patescibacteria group bacterium]|nr:hypothetical protein [Patescibacteria group bacterium]
MRSNSGSQGYTVLEVMIFLAISGLMFVLAASFISGKQSKSQFKQGMNDFKSNIMRVENDVSNGFFPSNANFSCTAGSAGQPTFGATAKAQGTNQGCAFIGKIVQFVPDDGTVSGGNKKVYNLVTLAGRQYQSDVNSLPPESFAQSRPIAIYSPAGTPDLTEKINLQWGLEVTKVYTGADNHTIGAFGMFSSFSKSSSGTLDTGGQSTLLMEMPSSTMNQTETSLAGSLGTAATLSALDAAVAGQSPTISVCLKGDNNQHGLLTVGGGNGQRLATTIQVSDTAMGSCPA